MSAAVLATDAIAAGDLEGLCRAVWERIARQLNSSNVAAPWVFPLLQERLHRVRRGMMMTGRIVPEHARAGLLAEFEADLREMLVMPSDRLRGMVQNHSTNPRTGESHVQEAHREAEAARAAWAGSGMPREQPGDLVQRFAARGVLVAAVDGALHVTPADALTPADRAVLVEHKLAILAALGAPAAVI